MPWFLRILRFTNKLNWIGGENMDKLGHGGFVVVANHGHALDPFYIGEAFQNKKYARRVKWVSKIENFTTPIQKSIIKPFGTIPLGKNKRMTPETKRLIIKTLKENDGVGMFPEGGRNRTKNKISCREFHSGAALICLDNKVPYIPVAIVGNRNFFKGKVQIRLGKPVWLKSDLVPSYEIAKEISCDMQEQVQALLDGNYSNQPPCRYEDKTREVTIKLRYKFQNVTAKSLQ